MPKPKSPELYKRPSEKVFLSGLKVMVLPGAARELILAMFAKHGATRADTIKEAELVVFTGGVDVDPELYGEKATRHTPHIDKERDAREKDVYDQCLEWDVPMLGICRGSQFLHVMNGGKLWQHVTGHCGNHPIVDLTKNKWVYATSTHHQMWKVNDKMDLIAVAEPPQASLYVDAEGKIERKNLGATDIVEPEAAYYPKTKTLIIQGHPEFDLGGVFEAWCMDIIFDTLRDIYD